MDVIQDYKDNEPLRKSFDNLAKLVFDISFEQWYQKGFGNNSYKCHSIIHDGNVISNVSTTEMNLVMNGETKRAIQIGTVMTHPRYRNQGLSDKLMKMVIEQYGNKVDFFYLFPNESVMNFYPRYGFKKYHDVYYSVKVSTNKNAQTSLVQVNTGDGYELERLYNAVLSRKQISSKFDTNGCESIYMWHSMCDLCNCIYRISETDDYLVYFENDKSIELYDVISKNEYSIKNILQILGLDGEKTINLHFFPDELKEEGWEIKEHKNEDMFFKGAIPASSFSHQIMAHT
ncbi:Acetyltransferase, GNAT family, potentially associated with YqeK [Chitinispirillum alkaliphilum]|nr:Acetyltransferase, GNAT family, potentially associated with YqeK [Chitinispirillum alkaliphilum]